MTAFVEGYDYGTKHSTAQISAYQSGQYVKQVEEAINTLYRDLNAFEGFKTKSNILKGDTAEYWHADTFNIDAKAQGGHSGSHAIAWAAIVTSVSEVSYDLQVRVWLAVPRFSLK